MQEGTEQVPVFVDGNGKGAVFPTVFLLWKVPEAVETVVVGSPVSAYLMNGADLMWPGVCSAFSLSSKYPRNTILSITVQGNPLPFAIGQVLDPGNFTSPEQISGKFIQVFHVFRDELWALHPFLPNPGFGHDQVLPVIRLSAPIQVDISHTELPENTENAGIEEEKEKIEDKNPEFPSISTENPPKIDETPQIIDENPPKIEETPQIIEETKQIPPEIIDENLRLCFLTTLLIGVNSEDLPLEPSRLMSIMSLCKPKNMQIDVKLSSYRKIGGFLKKMHKNGVISYTKVKGFDHDLITEIHKSHSDFTDFEPIVREKAKEKAVEGSEEVSPYPKVRYTWGLRPGKELRRFCEVVGLGRIEEVVMSKEDVQATLRDYISANHLEENVSSKKVLRLDPLFSSLFHAPIDSEIPKSTFFTGFMNKFIEVYIKEDLSGVFPVEVKVGQIPKVTLTLSRKIKGKKTTLIEGLEQYNVDAEEMLQSLQHMLATSGFVQVKNPEPGSNLRKVDVQIMGVKYKDSVITRLVDYYKIPLACIEVKDFIKPKAPR